MPTVLWYMPMFGKPVWGVSPFYLLDTDNELNSEFDRPITHHLYGGDWENRLKQEILLGIGGMMTLKALGITKDVISLVMRGMPH